MNKIYKITVDGTSYQVEVEDLSDQITPVATKDPSPKKLDAPPSNGEPITIPPTATTLSSPLSGTILSLNVAVGDTVKKNQLLLTLQSMNMENEISSPKSGTVIAFHVEKGTVVQAGSPLVSLT